MEAYEAIHLLKTKKYKYAYNPVVKNPIMFELDLAEKSFKQHGYYDGRGLDGEFGNMEIDYFKSLTVGWAVTNLENGYY